MLIRLRIVGCRIAMSTGCRICRPIGWLWTVHLSGYGICVWWLMLEWACVVRLMGTSIIQLCVVGPVSCLDCIRIVVRSGSVRIGIFICMVPVSRCVICAPVVVMGTAFVVTVLLLLLLRREFITWRSIRTLMAETACRRCATFDRWACGRRWFIRRWIPSCFGILVFVRIRCKPSTIRPHAACMTARYRRTSTLCYTRIRNRFRIYIFYHETRVVRALLLLLLLLLFVSCFTKFFIYILESVRIPRCKLRNEYPQVRTPFLDLFRVRILCQTIADFVANVEQILFYLVDLVFFTDILQVQVFQCLAHGSHQVLAFQEDFFAQLLLLVLLTWTASASCRVRIVRIAIVVVVGMRMSGLFAAWTFLFLDKQ